jgi:hypothetical protein
MAHERMELCVRASFKQASKFDGECELYPMPLVPVAMFLCVTNEVLKDDR